MLTRTPVKTGPTDQVKSNSPAASKASPDLTVPSIQVSEVGSNQNDQGQDKDRKYLSSLQGSVTRRHNEIKKLMKSPSNLNKMKEQVRRCVEGFEKYSAVYEECLGALPAENQDEAHLLVTGFLMKQKEQEAMLCEAQAWIQDASVVLEQSGTSKAGASAAEEGAVQLGDIQKKIKSTANEEATGPERASLVREQQAVEEKIKEAEMKERRMKERELKLEQDILRSKEREARAREEAEKKKRLDEQRKKEEALRLEEEKQKTREKEIKAKEERKQQQRLKDETRKNEEEKKKLAALEQVTDKKEIPAIEPVALVPDVPAYAPDVPQPDNVVVTGLDMPGHTPDKPPSDNVVVTGLDVPVVLGIQSKGVALDLPKLEEWEKLQIDREEVTKRLAELQLREKLQDERETLARHQMELEEKQIKTKLMEQQIQLEMERWDNMKREKERRELEMAQWAKEQKEWESFQERVAEKSKSKPELKRGSNESKIKKKSKGKSKGSRSGSSVEGETAADAFETEKARDRARLRELKESHRAWAKVQDLKLKLKKEKYEEEVKRLEAKRKSYERDDSDALQRIQSEPNLSMTRKGSSRQSSRVPSTDSEDSDLDEVFKSVLDKHKTQPRPKQKKERLPWDSDSTGGEASGGESSNSDGDFRLGKGKREGDLAGARGRYYGSSSSLLPLKLPRFAGDPLEYADFRINFETRIERKVPESSELLAYLKECLEGRALDLVNSVHRGGNPGKRYRAAWRALDEHYNDPRVSADSLIRQIADWRRIPHEDGHCLKKFTSLLERCLEEKKSSKHMDVLDSHSYVSAIKNKLSEKIKEKWCEQVVILKREKKRHPIFKDLVKFVCYQSDIINEPLYGQKNFTVTGDSSAVISSGTVRRAHSTNSFLTEGGQAVSISTGAGGGQEICSFCNGPHFLDMCSEFLKRSLAERKTYLIVQKLCFACLRTGHVSSQCVNRLTCRMCSKRHATVLHYAPRTNASQGMVVAAPAPVTAPAPSTGVTASNYMATPSEAGDKRCLDTQPRVYHPVVPVWLQRRGGGPSVKTYAFLDGGSSSCFIAEHLADTLGSEGKATVLKLRTLHGAATTISNVYNDLTVRGLDSPQVFHIPRVFSRQSIGISNSCIPRQSLVRQWPHLGEVAREMSPFQADTEIGLLLGNNCTEALEPLKIVPSGGTSLFAVKFSLGWTVQGPTQPGKDCEEEIVNRTAVQEAQDLREMVVQFFESDFLEDRQNNRVGQLDMSPEDRQFMQIAHKDAKHDGTRYTVPLPFKDPEYQLPNNKPQAESRARGQYRKMEKDPQYGKEYKDFVKKMLDRGHAAKVPKEKIAVQPGRVWYLPHHGVRHPTKKSLRVVFDASARFGPTSLNNVLLQGPNFINNVFSVLTRFRQHKIAVVADIQAMFYQVVVPEEHRSYLRFLWWNQVNQNGPILEEYEMQSHIFGAVSSPSVAMFVLRKTAEDFAQSPLVEEAIKNNFYVDDLLVSCPTEKEATDIAQGLTECCRKGGFKLTKFMSNSTQVMEKIPSEDHAEAPTDTLLDKCQGAIERTLGLYWQVGSDRLRFALQVKDNPFTRRGVLSVISSVYDPLGVLAPAVLPAKRLLQMLCKENKVGWDDPLPQEHHVDWERWLTGVPKLNEVSIPRSFDLEGSRDKIQQVSVFCDASMMGQAAVAYLLCQTPGFDPEWRFIAGKARVAPINAVATIPRLELTAAVTAVTLASAIENDLQYPVKVTFFTDSEAVLKYLANQSQRQTVFVSNRVRLIRSRSQLSQWNHVSTSLNPADVGSRGLTPEAMVTDTNWLYGPKFTLTADSTSTHGPTVSTDRTGDTSEQLVMTAVISSPTHSRTVKTATTNMERGLNIIDRLIAAFSSWFRLRRATVYVLKFGIWLQERAGQTRANQNSKTWTSTVNIVTTAEDVKSTGRTLIAWVQRQFFDKEMADIRDKGFVNSTSTVLKLSPVLLDGLLCVGGRLKHSNLNPVAKHPIILPRSHPVTRLVIRFIHAEAGHVGRHHTAALVRQQFWIIGGTSTIRNATHDCVICRKIIGPFVQQQMANLPPARVNVMAPFSHTGVDYFGPFTTKMGRKECKRYGVIFTCLSMRGCHLEVSSSLDTSAFILALRRFIARRGAVNRIYSDNGTNFAGAEKELARAIKDLDQTLIHGELAPKQIQWHFNPPHASHMGGLWERQIRSTRKILAATLRTSSGRLTDEQLSTFFCEAELIMNSRPLTTLSADPKDPEPISASQLLTLKTGPACLPVGKFVPEDMYARKYWRHVQLLAETFWSRWKTEFLSNLHPRAKWTTPQPNLKVGDTVLLREENVPRGHWPLGTVTQTEPDSDGQVRTVWLQTSTNDKLRRPVQKLVFLFHTD